MAGFAAGRHPFCAPPIALQAIDGFLALTLSTPCPAMDALAADCVAAFDPFRRPPDTAEFDTRRSRGLTPRQEQHLLRWGYPYVFEDFRFHMTLTGRLDEAERAVVETALQPLVAPFCAAPFEIEGIALFRQPDRNSPFLLTERFPFAG